MIYDGLEHYVFHFHPLSQVSFPFLLPISPMYLYISFMHF